MKCLPVERFANHAADETKEGHVFGRDDADRLSRYEAPFLLHLTKKVPLATPFAPLATFARLAAFVRLAAVEPKELHQPHEYLEHPSIIISMGGVVGRAAWPCAGSSQACSVCIVWWEK